MNLEYTPDGTFVPETKRLIEELQADAVLVLVFGSRTKGSGACCEMRAKDPERLGWIIVGQLQALAESLGDDLLRGKLEDAEVPDDQDRHKQEKQQYRARSLRPGEPSTGDHL